MTPALYKAFLNAEPVCNANDKIAAVQAGPEASPLTRDGVFEAATALLGDDNAIQITEDSSEEENWANVNVIYNDDTMVFFGFKDGNLAVTKYYPCD